MKIIGIKDYQQQEISANDLMQLAIGYHNSRYSMRVAGIWDTLNSRILIGLDDDANGSEKSGGPSGTHYLLRSLNSIYVSEFDLQEVVDLTDGDSIPHCVDFDIDIRGDQLVANLPHHIASLIPGVVGVEKAKVRHSWVDVFGYTNYVFKELDSLRVRTRIRDSLKRTAKAAGMDWWQFAEDFFKSLDECEPLQVAVVETMSQFKDIYGNDSIVQTMALSHVDAGFSGTETCKNGEIKIEWNRRPRLVLHI